MNPAAVGAAAAVGLSRALDVRPVGRRWAIC